MKTLILAVGIIYLLFTGQTQADEARVAFAQENTHYMVSVVSASFGLMYCKMIGRTEFEMTDEDVAEWTEAENVADALVEHWQAKSVEAGWESMMPNLIQFVGMAAQRQGRVSMYTTEQIKEKDMTAQTALNLYFPVLMVNQDELKLKCDLVVETLKEYATEGFKVDFPTEPEVKKQSL